MTRAPAAPADSPILLWAPVVAYMALIFGLSAMSNPPAPPQVSDKTEHFAAYAGLALVTLRAVAGGRLRSVRWSAVVIAWTIAATYGVSDEFHQSFVPGRTPDIADVAADALGAAVALLGAFGIIWGFRGRSDRA